ncbi:MAG: imidazole glycerol phosphate synthase subunit HisH [Eubacterium sp.]|nr:imidazole glycerol phosphate synthase subunit HisH [Eubacterium sp.]
MISIIDYDAGNIKSVEKAIEFLGEEVEITSDKEKILASDGVILPGVGAFGVAMEKLHSRNLAHTIKEYAKTGKPFLGICLGLQLLFDESDETPGVKGLGLLEGKIKRIPSEYENGTTLKVPHIGWNSIDINPSSKLMKGIPSDSYVYFVHSFYLEAANPSDVIATTEYGVKIHAAVERDNIMATQFHPEKSSDVGLKILSNFIAMTKEEGK